ncbi:MAG: apolipoprotein N-acyltransferase [Lentimicrobiaceae bacterium]|nr:apolipoprotein N-acyltransferase [Lentimicrobiaceae bacterium]
MKKIYQVFLSVLSGVLLTVSWPAGGFPLFLLVALVPLLIIEYYHFSERKINHAFGIFGYAFLSFFIWNLFTTWWIYNSTLVGVIFALLFNTLFLSTIFTLFHITHRLFSRQWVGYLGLILYWTAFEFHHLDWDLSWPWLNLGNGFASYPQWVQWYEYTGALGGSLWILLVNICIFLLYRQWFVQKKCSLLLAGYSLGTLLLAMVPMIFSVIRYNSYTEVQKPVNVLVVQPNINPYTEQYDFPPQEITRRLLQLAATKTDSSVQFIVTPESAIQEYIWENYMNQSKSFDSIRTFLRKFPNTKMVVGLSSRKVFLPGEPPTHTARKFRDADEYYDAYNTAALIDTSVGLQTHHKSKLTPGVEMMPFAKYLTFMESFAIDLGGTVGSLGTDPLQIPFRVGELSIAPIICYESVYGEYVASFVRNGAELIFVITNDGWWGNTPGHRQHLTFSSLRAIETRRSIARSANTGISAFVNQRGDITQATPYWTPAVIKQQINANDTITFYVRYGDFIGRACYYISGILLVLVAAFSITQKRRLKELR